jgi:hypothetical protein
VTNPLQPVTVANGSGATLQVSITDCGEPGTADTIAITLTSKNGQLLYSSEWTGTKTIERLLGGGNLAVH